jgi:UDP:flavonoid glycosyltransferase YjiC (YdhE family)
MRVLFSTSNWTGHYFCMVPLGWALEAAGHEVRVACTPAQAGPVSSAGLVPVPVLDSPDTMYLARSLRYLKAASGADTTGLPVLDPDTGEPVSSLAGTDTEPRFKALIAQVRECVWRSADAIAEFARAWRPELVVHDLLNEDGALAAALTGVPAVAFGPGLIGTIGDIEAAELGSGDPFGAFGRHGLPAWNREQIAYFIDPSPACALPPAGRALRMPVRYIPYNGPGCMPDWALRRPGRPMVCVLWGNATSGTFGYHVPSLRASIEAAADLGAEVVLTAGERQAAALGTLPPTVRVLRSFPLHLLLKTATAIVHPASSNGVMGAAVAGVPQLNLPLRAESLYIGPRIALSGAAISLPGATASAAEIRSALQSVLHEERYRLAAGRLRDELADYPSPAELVGTLVRLARKGYLEGAAISPRPVPAVP